MQEFLDNPDFVPEQDRPRPYNRQVLIDIFDSGDSFEDFENLGKYEETLYIGAIGCGKSYISSLAITYIVYRLLCLRDPQSYFKMASGTKIAFINISKSFNQAKDVVFGEIKNRLDHNRWIQTHYPPDPRIKSKIRLPKNIYILPLGSNEEAPLGYNIFGAVIDEASFHILTREKDYAEESYNQIKKRIRSRFLSKGKLFIITSPRYVYDFAERKFEEEKDNPKVFRRRTPLWEAIPPDFYSGEKFDIGDYLPAFKGVMCPIEYEDEFRQNPERAMRDLGAQPSQAIQSFFSNPDLIEQKINYERKDPINPKTGDFYEWFYNIRGKENYDPEKRYLHIDLAVDRSGKGDKIGLCLGKHNGWVETKLPDGRIEKRPKIFIDLIMRISAKPREEIQFEEIRKIIYKLRDIGYNIHLITFDQWNSIEMIQTLNSAGFKAEVFSVDRNPEAYYTLKSALLDGRIDIYYYKPLIDELKQLEEIKGGKIDHPRNSYKDCSDALAAVVYKCSKGKPGTGFLIAG